MKKNEQKDFLEQQNFVPSKKMGQNFLINENLKQKIVELSNLQQDDYVLEIGPGLGAISKYLIEAVLPKHYLAIELDKRLYDFLNKHFQATFINDDVLKVNLDQLLVSNNFKDTKVVANLPYSISSQIILKLLKSNQVKEIVILVQKEMAQRLLAKVNTKDYNAFSILVSLFSDVSYLLNISHKNFYPQPKVESWLIKITKTKALVNFDEIEQFLKLAFLAKRKKLINNLSTKINKELLVNIFNKLNLDLNIRPENLNKDQYVLLFNYLKDNISWN